MNSSKTELILFGSKRQLEKSTTKAININEKEIRSMKCIRYLGVFLDGNLNFKEHNYQQKKKKNAAKLWIKRIRKYVTKEATEILVLSLHALVISHLDYCNVILSGIVQGEIKCKEFKICVQKSEKI